MEKVIAKLEEEIETLNTRLFILRNSPHMNFFDNLTEPNYDTYTRLIEETRQSINDKEVLLKIIKNYAVQSTKKDISLITQIISKEGEKDKIERANEALQRKILIISKYGKEF